VGPIQWPVGLFQLHFPLVTPLVYNLIFLKISLLEIKDLLQMLTINLYAATLPTQLPAHPGKCRQRSYSQCISQAMGRGKINFFDVLYKYECSKGKCVKSALFEFSSGVFICRYKWPQSDLGPLFYQDPRPPGVRGPYPGSCTIISVLKVSFMSWAEFEKIGLNL